MSISVFAPAKINLTLEVGAPRADGLHPLQSMVMFADVGDVLEAEPAPTLTLSIQGEFAGDLAADESNLVLRAARALAGAAGIAAPGARLTLEKNLPVASGIGGGSADAAAALRALNELWALDMPSPRLQQIARTLGADVPVCVASTPAYMTGTGETWAPLHAPALHAVLVNPLQPLPTPTVYRRFDEMKLGGSFTARAAPPLEDAVALIDAVKRIGNDLEAPARALLPELNDLSSRLRTEPRALAAGLSGSGATMFAITATLEAAAELAEQIQREQPGWWVSEATLAGA